MESQLKHSSLFSWNAQVLILLQWLWNNIIDIDVLICSRSNKLINIGTIINTFRWQMHQSLVLLSIWNVLNVSCCSNDCLTCGRKTTTSCRITFIRELIGRPTISWLAHLSNCLGSTSCYDRRHLVDAIVQLLHIVVHDWHFSFNLIFNL